MIIYRISDKKYSDIFDGMGAKIYGGRWNSPGFFAIYTAHYISLAALETLVRVKFTEIPESLVLIKVSIPDKVVIKSTDNMKLKSDWKKDINYTRFIGDSFLKENSGAVLQIPSAVIEEESNFLINPRHKDFVSVKVVSSEPFHFDKRLFPEK